MDIQVQFNFPDLVESARIIAEAIKSRNSEPVSISAINCSCDCEKRSDGLNSGAELNNFNSAAKEEQPAESVQRKRRTRTKAAEVVQDKLTEERVEVAEQITPEPVNAPEPVTVSEPVAEHPAEVEVAQPETVAEQPAVEGSAQPEPMPERVYSLQDLTKAGVKMIDQGSKQTQALMGLLAKFNVNAITKLKPEQYADFAKSMREIGADI